MGSSQRNHSAEVKLMGQSFQVKRIGTDGDLGKMIRFIRENDGKVDAFGLGGMDLYIQAIDRRYTIRDALKVANAAKRTPIVDGSGLKNTLERRVVEYLKRDGCFTERKKSGGQRHGSFWLIPGLEEAGCEMSYGILFCSKPAHPLKSLHSLALIARLAVPVIRLLPFTMIYPTGNKQENTRPRHSRFFQEADIIAGDFHFIRRYMPAELPAKIIITNTITPEDLEMLRGKGVKMLITTTPEIEGRSFGTNVMEALLVAYTGSKAELKPAEYEFLLRELDFRPRLVSF